MKKLLVLCPLAFAGFMSCNKTDIIHEQNNDVGFNPNRPVITTVTSSPYSQAIFDTCTNECVDFSGTETYKLSQDSANTYIRYEIDLTNVVGVGEVSNSVFTGGGKIVDMTKTNADGSNVIGKIHMRIVYSSLNNKIIFRQTAKLVIINNITYLNFDTGYIESCK